MTNDEKAKKIMRLIQEVNELAASLPSDYKTSYSLECYISVNRKYEITRITANVLKDLN